MSPDDPLRTGLSQSPRTPPVAESRVAPGAESPPPRRQALALDPGWPWLASALLLLANWAWIMPAWKRDSDARQAVKAQAVQRQRQGLRDTQASRDQDVAEWDRLGEVCRGWCLLSGGLALAGTAASAWGFWLERRGMANPFWARLGGWALALWAAVGAFNAYLLFGAARWLW